MKSNSRIFQLYRVLFVLTLTQDFNENDTFKSRAADPQGAAQAN